MSETSFIKRFDITLDLKQPGCGGDFSVVDGDTGNVVYLALTDAGVPVSVEGRRIIAAFSNSITTRHGRTTRITMAGGDMIPCRSFAMSSHRSCTIIFWRSERNGFPRRSMSMAGDWMWLLTLDFPMNITISSGKNSAKS